MADDKHWLEPPKWWKKAKPLRWLAIGGIIFVVVSATWTAKTLIAPATHPETASFTAVAANPVVLFGQYSSYDTVDSAVARLEAAKAKVRKSSQHPPASGKYPPRDRDTLVAAEYTHLGVVGELTLEFFNDRLYEATFIPGDAVAYARLLHEADSRLKREPSNRIEFVDGPLRIASNVDFAATEVGRDLNTKPFAIWQDTRLVQSLDDWDRRYIISTPSR